MHRRPQQAHNRHIADYAARRRQLALLIERLEQIERTPARNPEQGTPRTRGRDGR